MVEKSNISKFNKSPYIICNFKWVYVNNKYQKKTFESFIYILKSLYTQVIEILLIINMGNFYI